MRVGTWVDIKGWVDKSKGYSKLIDGKLEDERYDESQALNESATITQYFTWIRYTESVIASRPFTVEKSGWVFYIAVCWLATKDDAPPCTHYIRLYRDDKKLDEYSFTVTEKTDTPVRRVALYGLEYLTPGNYTVYLKGVNSSDPNYLAVATRIDGSETLYGTFYPYYIGIFQITLE